MRIGILRTGNVNPAMVDRWGEYDTMFRNLLRSVDPSIETLAVDVHGGEALPAVTAADGWLITGSKHGVYEDHPWIGPLKAFLRRAYDAGVPVVGICFGHQILAEALGGRAEKSDRGWGLGVHDYEPVDVPDWLTSFARPWSGHAVHQDQVVEVPPTATVVAGSEFCPYAALVYGDPEAPLALSVQPHPEFEAETVSDLIDVRLAGVAPADRVAAARDRLGAPVNTDWPEAMVRFFRMARGARDSAA